MPSLHAATDHALAALSAPLRGGTIARVLDWHHPGLAASLEMAIAELRVRRRTMERLPSETVNLVPSVLGDPTLGDDPISATDALTAAIVRLRDSLLVESALHLRTTGSEVANEPLVREDVSRRRTSRRETPDRSPGRVAPGPVPQRTWSRPAMPSSDPRAILLDHHRWANEAILDACAELDEDALHRSFEMGLGSIHATLMHMLGALRGWGDMLAGRAQREPLNASGARLTVAEMREIHDEVVDDIEASADLSPDEELVASERNGRLWTFTRGAVITHVLTHGMHHRAQVINMLRHLGHDTLPMSSVLEWILHVDDPTEPIESS